MRRVQLNDVSKMNQQVIENPDSPGQNLIVVSEEWKLKVVFDFTAAGSQQQTANILQDSDFSIETITAIQTNPAYHIQVQDNSTSKLLFDSPMPAAAVTGTGQLPHEFRSPYTIRANGTIVVTVTNDTNVMNHIEIVFNGVKIYTYAAG